MPKRDGQFKKGQSGNPGGRPKIPEDVKLAKELTQNELVRIFNRLIFMTEAQFRVHIGSPTLGKFERAVARVLDRADQQGDYQRLDFLLNRLIGKVTDKVEHQGGAALTIISRIVNGQLSGEQVLIGEGKKDPC